MRCQRKCTPSLDSYSHEGYERSNQRSYSCEDDGDPREPAARTTGAGYVYHGARRVDLVARETEVQLLLRLPAVGMAHFASKRTAIRLGSAGIGR